MTTPAGISGYINVEQEPELSQKIQYANHKIEILEEFLIWLRPCKDCNGTGSKYVRPSQRSDRSKFYEPCPACHGSGQEPE